MLPGSPCQTRLRSSTGGLDQLVQNQPGSNWVLADRVRFWPNGSVVFRLTVSDFGQMDLIGFWLTVSGFGQMDLVRFWPNGSGWFLADRVRFGPNGSGLEASRCVRIILLDLATASEPTQIGSGMFIGSVLCFGCQLQTAARRTGPSASGHRRGPGTPTRHRGQPGAGRGAQEGRQQVQQQQQQQQRQATGRTASARQRGEARPGVWRRAERGEEEGGGGGRTLQQVE